jgi:3-dehydroquinate dehydratase type I
VKAKICAVITDADLAAIAAAAPWVDLFEVRIDLIGEKWPEVARKLTKPWLACNRLAAEGGRWDGTEARRKEELLKALDMGASIIDLELATPNLPKMAEAVKKKARCLISYHNFSGTPPFEELKGIIERQLTAGADICKLVTSATAVNDNLKIMRLYGEFTGRKLVAFGMGEAGTISRVLAPLAGAEFIYASLETGKQSAPGQMTVAQLTEIYRLLKI